MKKTKIICISFFLALVLSACSSFGKVPIDFYVAETIAAMDLEATHAAEEAQMEASTQGVNERDNPFGEFTLNRAVTIAESMVYDTEQVKISVKSLNFDDSSNPEILFIVENNTDNELSLRALDMQINGFMMTGVFDSRIPAQSQKTVALKVDYDELVASGVETIQYIELNLAIDESQTWSQSITTDRIHVNTSADPSGALAIIREGTLLLEREGIRLSLIRIESPNHYTGARLFILAENNTDIDVQLSMPELQVNGHEMVSSYSVKLLAGMKSIRELSFGESQQNVHDINRIDTLSFYLNVSHKNSSELLFKSELIEINFDQEQ